MTAPSDAPPREPTEVMVRAAYDISDEKRYFIDRLPDYWRAMWDAWANTRAPAEAVAWLWYSEARGYHIASTTKPPADCNPSPLYLHPPARAAAQSPAPAHPPDTNIHGIGPDTDGGPNFNYERADGKYPASDESCAANRQSLSRQVLREPGEPGYTRSSPDALGRSVMEARAALARPQDSAPAAAGVVDMNVLKSAAKGMALRLMNTTHDVDGHLLSADMRETFQRAHDYINALARPADAGMVEADVPAAFAVWSRYSDDWLSTPGVDATKTHGWHLTKLNIDALPIPEEETVRVPLYAHREAQSAGADAVRSSEDLHQRRGMALDIILEALNEYDSWMVDDDYNAQGALIRIMDRMRERYKPLAEFAAQSPSLPEGK